MQQSELISADMRVLSEQIYQYKKGVRQMVLYTFHKRYESLAKEKLERQHISYIIQPVGNDRVNLFFGRKACLDTIRYLVQRPLSDLTPEEDFILGAMLGYDITVQCERYCKRKEDCGSSGKHCSLLSSIS